MALSGRALTKAALLGAALLFLLAACAGPESFGGSRANAVEWAGARGFQAGEIAAGPFRLLSLARSEGQANGGLLSIYIEGDGAPWVTPWHPPRDPTPVTPIALALAAADPTPAVVYLGRPCQYLDAGALAACDPDWWMERRFAPEVVAAYDTALDELKARTGARRLRLVGHSGGGVLATLLAQRRTDVELLVTVAAPLALGEWLVWHDLAALPGSIDPLRQPGGLPRALHWAGGRDRIVPPAIVGRFAKEKGGRVIIMPGHDHVCCWVREWAHLVEKENSE